MADSKVQDVQIWLNNTYSNNPNWVRVDTDGRTGFYTVKALIRALQIELGTDADGNFGNGTKNLFNTRFPDGLNKNTTVNDQSTKNIIAIINGGFWCRGIEGEWNDRYIFGDYTEAGVILLKSQLGVSQPKGDIRANEIRAILTTDAYELVNDGDSKTREIQQTLNRKYLNILGNYIATNGIYERNMNKALIKIFQNEIGVTADGDWGNNTLNNSPLLQRGSNRTSLVYILQYLLYLNGFDPNGFDGGFGNGVEKAVTNFQNFVKLDADGLVGKQTWASLFVSCGDQNRRGQACDCVTEITKERAQTLKAEGYTTVGRYLTNAKMMDLDKNIKPNEIQTILNNGLTIFPIFQTWGIYVEYFTKGQGIDDAIEAYKAAKKYGFKESTIIYFAVDYDTYGEEIPSNIIPYFEGVNSKMRELGNFYRIGIYGTRNVCTKVSNKGLAVSSFVSDMSYGYSGNIGHKLPDNWAYDQISTITLGNGTGRIEIDNNISRTIGESSIDLGTESNEEINDVESGNMNDTLQSAINRLNEDMNAAQKLKALRSREEVANALKQYDHCITMLSNKYKVRKALIQTVFMWEYSLEGQDDVIADNRVEEYYDYKHQFEEWSNLSPEEKILIPTPVPPAMSRDDSSTGCCQIFASTAINAYNYAINHKFISGEKIDGSNWKEVEKVWKKLNKDMEYNIEMATLALIHAAAMVEISTYTYEYTDIEIEKVLARYNGTGDAAKLYGEQRKYLYDIFENHNSPRRLGQV